MTPPPPILTRCVLETDSDASYRALIESKTFSIVDLFSSSVSEVYLRQEIALDSSVLTVVDLEPATLCTVGASEDVSFIILPPRTLTSPDPPANTESVTDFCDMVTVEMNSDLDGKFCVCSEAFMKLLLLTDDCLVACGDGPYQTVVRCKVSEASVGQDSQAIIQVSPETMRNIRAAAMRCGMDGCLLSDRLHSTVVSLAVDFFVPVTDSAMCLRRVPQSEIQLFCAESVELCPAFDDFVLKRLLGDSYMDVLGEVVKASRDALHGRLVSQQDIVSVPLNACSRGAGMAESVLVAVERYWSLLCHQEDSANQFWACNQHPSLPFRVASVSSSTGAYGYICLSDSEKVTSRVSLTSQTVVEDFSPVYPPKAGLTPYYVENTVADHIRKAVQEHVSGLAGGFTLVHGFRDNLLYEFMDAVLGQYGLLALHVSVEGLDQEDLLLALQSAVSGSCSVAYVFHDTAAVLLTNPLVQSVLDGARDKADGTGALVFIVNESADSVPPSISSRAHAVVEVPNPNEDDREIFLKRLFETLCDKQSVHISADLHFTTMASWTVGLTFSDLIAYAQLCLRGLSGIVLPPGSQAVLGESHCQSALKSFVTAQGYNLVSTRLQPVRWSDVGGLEDAKQELKEAIQLPILYPELFSRQGVKKRSGILFYGPPGCGKTLLAKAVATEMNMNFMSVKGPELINQYVGESERNIRALFQRARDNSPCIIFFDELDALAPARGAKGDGGGAMDRIVAQLLVEVDGVGQGQPGSKTSIFIIGATNRPDLLDPSLLRPGRFDRLCYLGLPATKTEQLNAVKALTRKFSLSNDVDLEKVVEPLDFLYTGADFFALCSDAMMFAVNDTLEKMKNQTADAASPEVSIAVTMNHFIKARDQLKASVSVDDLKKYEAMKNKF